VKKYTLVINCGLAIVPLSEVTLCAASGLVVLLQSWSFTWSQGTWLSVKKIRASGGWEGCEVCHSYVCHVTF